MKTLIIGFFLALAATGYASSKSGTSAAQFLKLGAGARATAMADAFGAVADDATALYWNPAGLTQVKERQASLMHALWFESVSYDWISYVQPSPVGNFGLGLQYLSYGSITGADETGLETGSFKPNDLALSLGYGTSFQSFLVGAAVKYISSKIQNSASAVAFDAGGLLRILNERLTLGLAVQNIGTKMKFVDDSESLPVNIKLASAYRLKDNWTAALDINAYQDSDPSLGFGTEYARQIRDSLTLKGRAGYTTKTKETGGFQGLTLGFGAGYQHYSFDYAFVPLGKLGDTHRFSVSAKF